MKIEESFLTLSESSLKSLLKTFSMRFQKGFIDYEFEIYYRDNVENYKKNGGISQLNFSVNVDKDD